AAVALDRRLRAAGRHRPDAAVAGAVVVAAGVPAADAEAGLRPRLGADGAALHRGRPGVFGAGRPGGGRGVPAEPGADLPGAWSRRRSAPGGFLQPRLAALR